MIRVNLARICFNIFVLFVAAVALRYFEAEPTTFLIVGMILGDLFSEVFLDPKTKKAAP